MKTETEIAEYRKEIEQRLINTESMDAMKYYQGVLRSLEWVITGKDVYKNAISKVSGFGYFYFEVRSCG